MPNDTGERRVKGSRREEMVSSSLDGRRPGRGQPGGVRVGVLTLTWLSAPPVASLYDLPPATSCWVSLSFPGTLSSFLSWWAGSGWKSDEKIGEVSCHRISSVLERITTTAESEER